jgi:uncharacterized iron-regulated protein
MRLHPLSTLLLAALLSACASGSPSVAPEPAPAAPLEEGEEFRVYRSDGTPASLEEIVQAAGSADAVLIGEEHTDYTTHQIQAFLFQRVYMVHGSRVGQTDLPSPHPAMEGEDGPWPADRPVVLSLEMFETDVQSILDEYLADLITEDHFKRSARPWERYDRDYRPAVEFARVHGLEVVAANAPRRYVNRASRLGKASLDELSEEARSFLPPLPYPDASEAYQAEWDALMGAAAQHMRGSPLDGQTLWDASMGHSIARALDRNDGGLVVHFAGGFHVENHTGIPETLVHYRPGTRILVVAARPTEDPGVFGEEHQGLGDFVILTREPVE